MIYNKLINTVKKIACILGITVLMTSLTFSEPTTVSATTETSTPANTAATVATYKFADIDLQVNISDNFVCFTRNVTSNNSYLEKIGAENAEALRNTMIAGNIYLEAIPKDSELVSYEIIIVGDKLENTNITDLNSLSDNELKTLFSDYTSTINKKNDQVEETLTSSSIEKINDATYFVTEVSTVSATKVNVLLKKYYTIKNGYYYTFTIQTTEKSIANDMVNELENIVKSASYKEIKRGLFEGGLFSEIMSSVITAVAPIAVLGIIFFVLLKMTSKKKTNA